MVEDICGVGRTVQLEWVEIGGQIIREDQSNEKEVKES
jgi:hypothetical protein